MFWESLAKRVSGVEIQVDFRIEPGQQFPLVRAGLTFFLKLICQKNETSKLRLKRIVLIDRPSSFTSEKLTQTVLTC